MKTYIVYSSCLYSSGLAHYLREHYRAYIIATLEAKVNLTDEDATILKLKFPDIRIEVKQIV